MGAGQPLHGAGDLQSAAYPCPQSPPGRETFTTETAGSVPTRATGVGFAYSPRLPGTTSLAANMFLAMPREQVGLSEPDFTFIHAPGFAAEPDRDGTNSEAFIIIDFGQRIVLIGGTSYAGEIKKSALYGDELPASQ